MMPDTYLPQPSTLLAQAFPAKTNTDLQAQVVGRFAQVTVQVGVVAPTHPASASVVILRSLLRIQSSKVSAQPATKGIFQAVEHFPPGAQTWPDNIKPQIRVPAAIWPIVQEEVVEEEVEDSRTWPLKRHARVELEGTELWSRPGQPAIAASVVARVEGSAAVVGTGSVRGISSTVAALQGLESVLQISNPVGRARSEAHVVGSEVQSGLGSLRSEGLTNVALSGVTIGIRSGYVTALVGPDLEVLEDEEILFLLEVA